MLNKHQKYHRYYVQVDILVATTAKTHSGKRFDIYKYATLNF